MLPIGSSVKGGSVTFWGRAFKARSLLHFSALNRVLEVFLRSERR